MVVFKTNEGKPGQHWADSLEDAVRFVEHLRNNEQVNDAKVFRMQEVPLEFKVLYKVEVSGPPGGPADDAGPSSSGTAPTGSSAPLGSSSGEEVLTGGGAGAARATEGRTTEAPPIADSGNSGGRFGLFSRS